MGQFGRNHRVGYLVPPPCLSWVMPEHMGVQMGQECLQGGRLHSTLGDLFLHSVPAQKSSSSSLCLSLGLLPLSYCSAPQGRAWVHPLASPCRYWQALMSSPLSSLFLSDYPLDAFNPTATVTPTRIFW